jgi:hypothetical protein
MRRSGKRLVLVLAGVALVVLALRLLLDPLATWRTRRILEGLDGMRGTFSDVEIRLLDLSYAIRDLRIEKVQREGAALPFFEVERASFGLHWRELLRGNLVARIDLDGPKVNVIEAKGSGEASEGQEIEEAPKVGRRLGELAPFLVDRAQAKDGEILFVDAREPEQPRLRFHGIEATLENFATRAALSRGEPTVLAGRGTLQRSGRVSVFASADPLAKELTFAGQAKLEGLKLVELGELFAAKTGLEPDKGVLDLSIRFQAADGRISGGIRPILKDPGTRPAEPGLRAKIESGLADAALDIFSDDVPGRDAVATTIPLSGTVDDPDAQAIPTIVGILRNAFVRGLADSFAGLPPPRAAEREGALEQARRGLSRGEGQPRAQPEKGEE